MSDEPVIMSLFAATDAIDAATASVVRAHEVLRAVNIAAIDPKSGDASALDAARTHASRLRSVAVSLTDRMGQA